MIAWDSGGDAETPYSVEIQLQAVALVPVLCWKALFEPRLV